MHKKLVKYGNSTALIIDRAILELLNIHEGSIVKLRTDGTSLIITPTEEKPVSNVMLTGLETL
jgi:antitoxin component of MazEF toxin-antitoxin module